MVTIHTKEDLIRALQDDPEWRAAVRGFILTEELMALPVRFEQFTSEQKQFNESVTRFIDEQKQFNEDVTRFIDEQKQFNENVTCFIDEQKQTNQRVESRLANLDGDNLERRARENILNIAKDHLDLTRGRVLLSKTKEMDPGLRATLDEAEEQGLVTDNDISNLEVADIIMRGRRSRDRQYVHVVMEVSRTIRNDDIQRAHERAMTLAAATGEDTSAAVVGTMVQPPQQRLADELGVEVVTPTMFTDARTE